MSMKKLALVVGTVALLALALAAPAVAKQPPVTKMTFKLHGNHEMAVGTTVSLSVLAQGRSGHEWVGIPGASVAVRVDGVDVATAVADDTGLATFDYLPAVEGEHVMKAFYAGDELHKRSQRAQGFTVVPAAVPAG
jgi:hypothetical protein